MPDSICLLTGNTGSTAEEAYNVLRTNIKFCALKNPLKTITITSCMPGEGKTTTAINLSVSMAKSGMQVLFLDADLRKPMWLKNPGCTNIAGLSSLISGEAELNDTITLTNIDRLHLIPSGPVPPNPAEMINSEFFREILTELSQMYDAVIIDTPPICSVIDGAVIAAQSDATILVIKYKTVDYVNIQRAREQLEKANAKILGVVLNRMQKWEYRNYYGLYDIYSRKAR